MQLQKQNYLYKKNIKDNALTANHLDSFEKTKTIAIYRVY